MSGKTASQTSKCGERILRALSGYLQDTGFEAKTHSVTIGKDVQTFYKNEGSG